MRPATHDTPTPSWRMARRRTGASGPGRVTPTPTPSATPGSGPRPAEGEEPGPTSGADPRPVRRGAGDAQRRRPDLRRGQGRAALSGPLVLERRHLHGAAGLGRPVGRRPATSAIWRHADHELQATIDALYRPRGPPLLSRQPLHRSPRAERAARCSGAGATAGPTPGLAKMIEVMPADDPSRPRYVDLFRQMSERDPRPAGRRGLLAGLAARSGRAAGDQRHGLLRLRPGLGREPWPAGQARVRPGDRARAGRRWIGPSSPTVVWAGCSRSAMRPIRSRPPTPSSTAWAPCSWPHPKFRCAIDW